MKWNFGIKLKKGTVININEQQKLTTKKQTSTATFLDSLGAYQMRKIPMKYIQRPNFEPHL